MHTHTHKHTCARHVQSMRHEYEAVQAAKGSQEDEMRALKDRMILGVRRACAVLE